MSTNNTKSECVECGSEILNEHSYCLNCGYKPIKPIISTKQKMLLMLFVFLMSVLIIIVIVNNTSNETLSNVTNSINHNINKKINQPKQIDTDNNNQETDQVIISDKDHNSILNNSILKNVLNSEDIVRCGDRYFKIISRDLKLHLYGYEVIEFKNIKFEYNLRNAEDMTELERLNGLVLEIKYDLSFNYFRDYIFKGLLKNNKNTYMIERANWSDWSSTNGSLTNGVYSAYSNKQPEWSHNKSFRTTLPTCDEIIKATDSNYYLKKYADRINEINRWVAELQNLSNYFVKNLPPYYNLNSRDGRRIFYTELHAIETKKCFVYDANGEFNQEQITSCWDSINLLKSEMSKYYSQVEEAPNLLSAGAFERNADADDLKSRIALAGETARVETVEVNGIKMYRVLLGPYPNARAEEAVKANLTRIGISVTDTKVK